MKTLAVLLSLLALGRGAQAQLFVAGQPVPDSTHHLFFDVYRRDNRFRAAVDPDGTVRDRDQFLTNAQGTRLDFPTRAALFDYLLRVGWEYVDSVPVVLLNRPTTYLFLFRRRAVPAAR